MRSILLVATALCLVVSFTLVGCGPQKAASGTEAIETAKTMRNVNEQAKYLIAQARSFIKAEEFQYAIDVLQYDLKYLDKDSPEAKELLRKAQDALVVQMQMRAAARKR
jgi:hypothetical protein